MPANSGEPKAMMDLTTSFVYTILMGGHRVMKLLYKQLFKFSYLLLAIKLLCEVICKKNERH